MEENNISKPKTLEEFKVDETFIKIENISKIFQTKVTYIFGKNGSGKTTIANQINKKISKNKDIRTFIFDKTYISENIKESSTNIKNTYNIFIGKELINLVKEKEYINKKINYINDKTNAINWIKTVLFNSSFEEELKKSEFLSSKMFLKKRIYSIKKMSSQEKETTNEKLKEELQIYEKQRNNSEEDLVKVIDEIKTKNKKLSDNFIERINFHLKSLNENYLKVEMNIVNSDEPNNISLKIKNNSIKKLSAGQLSSLTFAYFLTNIEVDLIHEEKDVIIFIDDPFDSNDHFKFNQYAKLNLKCINDESKKCKKNNFHTLSNFVEEYHETRKKWTNLIIATHNAAIFNSFFQNICDNEPTKKKILFKKIKNFAKEEISLFQIIEEKNNGKLKKNNLKELKKFMFFPKNENLKEIYEILFLYLIRKETKSSKEIETYSHILRLIILLLIQFYDSFDSNKRNLFLKLIQGNWLGKDHEKNVIDSEKTNDCIEILINERISNKIIEKMKLLNNDEEFNIEKISLKKILEEKNKHINDEIIKKMKNLNDNGKFNIEKNSLKEVLEEFYKEEKLDYYDYKEFDKLHEYLFLLKEIFNSIIDKGDKEAINRLKHKDVTFFNNIKLLEE